MQKLSEDQLYCLDVARTEDRERYLTSLFMPAHARRAVWTLLAFNQEIAKIRDSVSETALGEIRLQWWKEALDGVLSGQNKQQPIVRELVCLQKIPGVWPLLHEILDARSLEMFGEGPADMDGLAAYANGVGGALNEAILRLLIQATPPNTALKAARASGSAWGMLGLLRALPFHWQSGRNPLPKDHDSAMQLQKPDDAFEALKPILLQMKAYVLTELEAVQGGKGAVPKHAKPALLCVPLARQHLTALKKAGNNPFEAPPYEASDLAKITRLFWSNITGRL